MIANGREPKSCLGQVFRFKLSCFAKCVQIMGYASTAVSRLENSAQVLTLKVDLHYGDYHSKLVPFEEQKNISYIFKRLYLRAIIAIV